MWLLPLLWQQAYTQSMRYTKLLPQGNFKLPSWMPLPGPVRHTLEGLRGTRSLRPPLDTNANPIKHFSPTLWLPWWIWVLAGVAIIAAGWYRRRSTLVLLVLALVIGVMFIEWPEHAIWNTRFLPFWMLSWAFLAAMGATEIARARRAGSSAARTAGYATVICKTRAPARGPRSRPPTTTTTDRRRGAQGSGVGARRSPLRPRSRRLGAAASGSPTRSVDAHGAPIGAIALAVVVVFGGVFALHRGCDATDNNPSIAIRGWADVELLGLREQGRRTRSTTRS